MSTKSADEAECKSVAATQSVKGSTEFEYTITLGDEFFAILELSFTYSAKPNSFSKKQVKAMEMKMDRLYNKVINLEHTSLYDIITLANSYEILCFVYRNKSDGKKEISMARNLALRCLSLIKDKELNPGSILIALKAYYHLGYIFSKQREFYKAIESYNKGVELYLKYTGESQEYDIPFDINVIVLPETLNGYEKLNTLYKNLLEEAIEFHKLQVPANVEYLMVYKHLHLAVQLRIFPKPHEFFNWLKETLLLHHDLVQHERFLEAWNHLITMFTVKTEFIAEYNIQKFFPSLDIKKEDEVITLDCFIVVINYYLKLLFKSAARLLRLEKDSVGNDLKLKYPTKSKNHVLQRLLLFDEMQLRKLFPNASNRLPMFQSISGCDVAYKLFTFTLSLIYNTRKVSIPTNDIELEMLFIGKTASAYKYIAFYEKSTASRNLLQKRCVEILSEAVTKDKYITRPDMLKHWQIQLAIGYSILIDEKLESFDETQLVGMPQRYAIMCEIDNLVKEALIRLKMYLSIHIQE